MPLLSAGPCPKRLIAMALLVGGVVLVMWGLRTTPEKLPNPNGYDDLAKAGSLIEGEWPNLKDIDKADPAALRSFVERNKAALDLARVGLGRESLVHFEDSDAGLRDQFEQCVRLKEAARLLAAEGLVAQSEKRIGDASRCFREASNVGQVLTQGGMLAAAQVGWFIQVQNAERLRKLRDGLSKEDLRATLRDLESLDRRRVPVQRVVDRWERWYRGTFNPFKRAMMAYNGIEATARTTETAQSKKAHDQAERSLRFLMVELAIHAFHEDRKSWPHSVADLVPGYLASEPIDPDTGKTIAYPANASGELTDDLDSVDAIGAKVKPGP
jgi:hypothetical protein